MELMLRKRGLEMEDKNVCCELRNITVSESVHEAMCQQDEINRIIGDIEFKLSMTPKYPLDEPVDPMGLEGKVMLIVQKNTQIMRMLENINNRI